MGRVRKQSTGHPFCGQVSRKGFVRLGAALGAGFVAAPLLAACGRSAEVEPGGGEALSGGPDVGGREAIAQAAGVKPGSAVPFIDARSGEQAVLLRLEGGEIAAYSAVCTHHGCLVAYDAEEGMLECPCHGSIFDPENGAEVVSGPAPRPLPQVPIEVQNGSVVRV